MTRVVQVVGCLWLCACATSRPERLSSAAAPIHGRGIFHTVHRGQNLFRISRAYGVSVHELAAANQLGSAAEIEAGMQLWIPRAARVLEVSGTAVAQQDRKAEPPKPSKPEAPVAPKPPPAKQVAVAPTPSKPGVAPVAPVAPAKPVAVAPPARVAQAPVPAEEPADGDDSDDATPPAPDKTPAHGQSPSGHARFIWPVKGLVESPFGQRGSRQHDGVDIKADKGTPVVAADGGDVLYAGTQRGYGNIVLIKHADDLITIYAHNDENRIKAGAHVKRGDVIAIVGQTGRASNNHLHFEVRKNRIPQDPLQYLPGPGPTALSMATHP